MPQNKSCPKGASHRRNNSEDKPETKDEVTANASPQFEVICRFVIKEGASMKYMFGSGTKYIKYLSFPNNSICHHY